MRARMEIGVVMEVVVLVLAMVFAFRVEGPAPMRAAFVEAGGGI